MLVTVTVEWSGRRPGALRRRLAGAWGAVRAVAEEAIKPHRASLSTLMHMPLYCAGVASVDFAAFHMGHGWGWLALGASLILTERIIADDE